MRATPKCLLECLEQHNIFFKNVWLRTVRVFCRVLVLVFLPTLQASPLALSSTLKTHSSCLKTLCLCCTSHILSGLSYWRTCTPRIAIRLPSLRLSVKKNAVVAVLSVLLLVLWMYNDRTTHRLLRFRCYTACKKTAMLVIDTRQTPSECEGILPLFCPFENLKWKICVCACVCLCVSA